MEKTAYIFVVVAAALWGIIGIFTIALSEMDFTVFQIVFIRALVSAIILFVIIFIKDRKLLRIRWLHFHYFVGTGILSFAFFNICYFTAINMVSISLAVILLYTAPIFVMIFSAILFNEKMTKRKLMALGLTFLGCIFVTVQTKGASVDVSFFGILIGLGSGLGYALYSIFGRYALKHYDSMTVTFYTFVFATIGLLPISNIKNIYMFTSAKAIYYSLALGILTGVLPFLLYTKGLSYLETGKASILTTIEPVVATIIGLTLFQESISLFKIIGIGLVLFAVSIVVEKKEKMIDVEKRFMSSEGEE